MGQEQSSPIDDSTPPQTLEKRSVDSIAKYIKEGRAKNIVVMVSFYQQELKNCRALESEPNNMSLLINRLGLASAHLRVFQIFDPQTPASTPISRDSICPILRLFLTYHFSETTHYPFTRSPTNYIPATTSQPSHIPLFGYFQIKASC